MKWDAKTIVALTGLVSVLLGGAELRLKITTIESKLDRVDERVTRIEREVSPRPLAQRN